MAPSCNIAPIPHTNILLSLIYPSITALTPSIIHLIDRLYRDCLLRHALAHSQSSCLCSLHQAFIHSPVISFIPPHHNKPQPQTFIMVSLITVLCSALLAGVAIAQGGSPTTNFSSAQINAVESAIPLADRSELSSCHHPRAIVSRLTNVPSSRYMVQWSRLHLRYPLWWRCCKQHLFWRKYSTIPVVFHPSSLETACLDVSICTINVLHLIITKDTADGTLQADLTWNCLCTSNNSAPALQYYQPTMYNFICTNVLAQCIASTAGSSDEQQNCRNTIVCGTLDATNYTAPTTTSSSSSATATATSSGTGTATSSTSTATSLAAASFVKAGEGYGFGILGAALFAAMGFML